MRPTFHRAITIALIVLAGCASAPSGRSDLLTFIADGTTRREDIFLKLGEPSSSYEGSRILAYRLSKDEGGYILVGRRDSWYGVQYNLMLVFDAEGVVRRHSLVQVRSP